MYWTNSDTPADNPASLAAVGSAASDAAPVLGMTVPAAVASGHPWHALDNGLGGWNRMFWVNTDTALDNPGTRALRDAAGGARTSPQANVSPAVSLADQHDHALPDTPGSEMAPTGRLSPPGAALSPTTHHTGSSVIRLQYDMEHGNAGAMELSGLSDPDALRPDFGHRSLGRPEWAGPPRPAGLCDVYDCPERARTPIGRSLWVCGLHQHWQQNQVAAFAAKSLTAASSDPAVIQAAITARLAGQGHSASSLTSDVHGGVRAPATHQCWVTSCFQRAEGTFTGGMGGAPPVPVCHMHSHSHQSFLRILRAGGVSMPTDT